MFQVSNFLSEGCQESLQKYVILTAFLNETHHGKKLFLFIIFIYSPVRR